MIIRIVSASTMKVIEVEDISQVVIFDDTMRPLVVSHETPDKGIIVANASEPAFAKIAFGVGVKPAETEVL